MYVTQACETDTHFFCDTADRLPEPQVPKVRLPMGDHLFFEGDEVTHVYRVEEGVLRLSRLMEDGRRQVIAFGYPGDIVGFPAAGKHHTDCDALTGAKLSSFRFAQPVPMSVEAPLGRELMHAAFQEIGAMQDHFMMLGRKSAVEKLASFLDVLARRVGEPVGDMCRIALPMSRADIADFLGLTTETVSRTFTRLRKARVIFLEDPQTVIITRPDALNVMARGLDS